MIFRKRSTSFKGILPNLPSGYQNTVHANRMEDTHKAALQELQEKETVLEQRRRCAWAGIASGLGDLPMINHVGVVLSPASSGD